MGDQVKNVEIFARKDGERVFWIWGYKNYEMEINNFKGRIQRKQREQFLLVLKVKYYYSISNMTTSYTRKKIEGYSYGLNDVIGKGYSSHVYKGRNDQTGEPVAVKVIDLRLLKNDINKVLLESEIQVLKELKALPHILALHEVYTTKNNTYIITELCDSDLSKLIRKGLPEQEALSFMQQVIAGYQNFARRDIIHRDLKPANILVAEGQLKIADFGFAIKVTEAAKSSKYNVGSPLYMAPQSLRRNEYSLRTDIWALGVIFYEILTGQTPWKAKNQKELIRKIEQERIDDLLMKMNLGTASKQFLRRTLKIDKSARMDLDELTSFSFTNSPSILAEKKLNIELRSVNLSHNLSMMTPKTEKNTDNRLYVDRSGENRRASKEHSQNKFNSFRNESINHSIQLKPTYNHKYSPSFRQETVKNPEKENPEEKIRHETGSNQVSQPTIRTTENKSDKKLISKILVSEIHFCRFLFKLLGKIWESQKKGILQHSGPQVESIMEDYTGIIRHKIEDLTRFSTTNFIEASGYEDYKQCSDYPKLMKIAKEYRERYSQQLKQYWETADTTQGLLGNSTVGLIEHLYRLLRLREHQDNFIDTYSREIVILDYLITSKQLIQLFRNGENYQKFARKSRIEEIVQGKTAEISRDLYAKIMGRAKEVALISPSLYYNQLQDRANLLMA